MPRICNFWNLDQILYFSLRTFFLYLVEERRQHVHPLGVHLASSSLVHQNWPLIGCLCVFHSLVLVFQAVALWWTTEGLYSETLNLVWVWKGCMDITSILSSEVFVFSKTLFTGFFTTLMMLLTSCKI